MASCEPTYHSMNRKLRRSAVFSGNNASRRLRMTKDWDLSSFSVGSGHHWAVCAWRIELRFLVVLAIVKAWPSAAIEIAVVVPTRRNAWRPTRRRITASYVRFCSSAATSLCRSVKSTEIVLTGGSAHHTRTERNDTGPGKYPFLIHGILGLRLQRTLCMKGELRGQGQSQNCTIQVNQGWLLVEVWYAREGK